MSHPNKTRIPLGDLERGTPASATTKRLEPGTPGWKAALEQLRADGLLEADEAPTYTPTDGAPSHPCEVCGEQARRTWTGGWDRVCSTECDRQQRAEAGSAEAETGKDAQEDEMTTITQACIICDTTFETEDRGARTKNVCSDECKTERRRRYQRERKEEKRTSKKKASKVAEAVKTTRKRHAVTSEDEVLELATGRTPQHRNAELALREAREELEKARTEAAKACRERDEMRKRLDAVQSDPLTPGQANAWRECLRELCDLGMLSVERYAQQLLELTRRETGVELNVELGEVA